MAEETEEIAKTADLNRTYYPKKIDTEGTRKPWFVVDAEGQILGRMSTPVATMIRSLLLTGPDSLTHLRSL